MEAWLFEGASLLEPEVGAGGVHLSKGPVENGSPGEPMFLERVWVTGWTVSAQVWGAGLTGL